MALIPVPVEPLRTAADSVEETEAAVINPASARVKCRDRGSRKRVRESRRPLRCRPSGREVIGRHPRRQASGRRTFGSNHASRQASTISQVPEPRFRHRSAFDRDVQRPQRRRACVILV